MPSASVANPNHVDDTPLLKILKYLFPVVAGLILAYEAGPAAVVVLLMALALALAFSDRLSRSQPREGYTTPDCLYVDGGNRCRDEHPPAGTVRKMVMDGGSMEHHHRNV